MAEVGPMKDCSDQRSADPSWTRAARSKVLRTSRGRMYSAVLVPRSSPTGLRS